MPDGQQYLTSSVNLCQLGMGVDESSVNNLAALQRGLDMRGNLVLAEPGIYALSGAGVIRSNTRVFFAPGVQFKLDGAANTNVLVNEAYSRTATTVSVSWSSGTTMTVTWSGHSRAVGDFVSLAGLTPSMFCGVFEVISVASSSSFDVRLYRVPTTSPSGTCVAKAADTNIVIEGLDYNYNYSGGNNNSAQVLSRVGVILGHIAKSSVRRLSATDVNKYGLCIGAAASVDVDGVQIKNTLSDGVKIYGPAYEVNCRNLGGTAHDDFISYQTREPDAFSGYRFTEGDILSCKVTSVGGASSGSGHVVLYGSPNQYIDDVQIDGVSPTDSTATFVMAGSSGYVGQYGRITVKNLAGNAARSADMRYATFVDVTFDGVRTTFSTHGIGTSVGGSVTGKRLECKGVHQLTDANTKYAVILNNFALEHLVVDGFVSESALSGGYQMQIASGTVDQVDILNCCDRSSQRLFDITSGAIRKVNLIGNTKEGSGDQTLHVGSSVTGSPMIVARDNDSNSTAFLSIDVGCDVSLSGNRLASHSNGAVRVTGTVTVDLRSDGTNQFKNSNIVVVVSGTPTITVRGNDLSVDVGATGFTKTTSGQYCFNNGAARGTLTQNRLVTCNGTNWVQVDNTANTF